MPNYRRTRVAGGSYFFTVVTFERRPLLISAMARACLHRAWQDTRAKHPFSTDAISLLPDHLHCIITLPEGDSDYPKRWSMIEGLFTKYMQAAQALDRASAGSRARKREAVIWQRRYWEHLIRDEDDLRRHLDYIHFNPVKHGYVFRPADWEWTSLHRYVRLGWYDAEWGAQGQTGFDDDSEIGE